MSCHLKCFEQCLAHTFQRFFSEPSPSCSFIHISLSPKGVILGQCCGRRPNPGPWCSFPGGRRRGTSPSGAAGRHCCGWRWAIRLLHLEEDLFSHRRGLSGSLFGSACSTGLSLWGRLAFPREGRAPACPQVSVTHRTVREHPPLFLKNGRTHCKSSSPFSTFKKSPCQQGGCQCSVAISPAWVFFSPQ